MHRTLAFLAALLLATITVTSTGFARDLDRLAFGLKPVRMGNAIQLSLRMGTRDGLTSNSFAASQFRGLDLAGLRGPVPVPVRFALVRDAGRFDCSGSGSLGRASGQCGFTADPAFADFLAGRGIARPNREQSFELAMVGARRDLVEALRSARYQTPTINDLTELSAVGVDRKYIVDLSGRGYRPARLRDVVEFAALGVTPDFIDGLARAGYRGLSARTIVEFKALGVTPEFIQAFARMGYRNLPVDTLVEMKALGVAPEFVRELEASGVRRQSPDQLVKLRAIGFQPRRRDRR